MMWEINGNYKGCTRKSRGNPCFQGSYGKLQQKDMEIQGKIRADLKLFNLQLLDFSISMLVYWRVHCKEISCSTSLSLEDTPPFWLPHNFPTSEFGVWRQEPFWAVNQTGQTGAVGNTGGHKENQQLPALHFF